MERERNVATVREKIYNDLALESMDSKGHTQRERRMRNIGSEVRERRCNLPEQNL